MPSKPDFQSLVDWCTQPAAGPLLYHSVGIALVRTELEQGERLWTGTLSYIPARASRWFPEHFSGAIRRTIGGQNVAFGFAVGDTYAGGYIGSYEEFDVESVEDFGGGVTVATWHADSGSYHAYLYNSISASIG